jgi:nucleotide-binding universal stress UspA family protein
MSIFPTKILLATDGSKEARLALTTAADMAQSTNSELHLDYVFPTAVQIDGLPALEPAFPEVRQSWGPKLPGHVRSVLLAILSREEYAERIEPFGRKGDPSHYRPEAPPVHITDLRLDACLGHQGVRDALLSSLSSIERPLTPSNMVEWKVRISREFSDAAGSGASTERHQGLEFRKAFVSAVTFSSAR